MNHGSLFSGIGGFDLAAQWMGWNNKFHCEINPFAQKILKYYWPKSESFTNIIETNFKKYEKKIDVLSGGFPCQPFSLAGKRKGTEDSRHLWPEMLRAIEEIKPRWIIGENVFGIVNWSNGLVFQQIQIDLEIKGYEVWTYILPAASVNAPHQRYRCWIIAYNDKYGCNNINNKNEINAIEQRFNAFNEFKQIYNDVSNTNSTGMSKAQWNNKKTKKSTKQSNKFCIRQNNWERFPIEQPVCYGNDGISNKLDGITFSKWKFESLKAAGNAVVPQLVLQLFKTIELFEKKKAINNDGNLDK